MAAAPMRTCFLIAGALLSVAACSEEPACEGPACTDAGMSPPTGDSGGLTEEMACAMQEARARRGPSKPLDVIFVVDNSGSMENEIAAVRANINDSFASIIEASGADFRVIVISKFGPQGTELCIGPPLASAECGAGILATNSERFFHYDMPIDSLNPLCKLLQTFDQPDMSGRTPTGWREYLRPDAHKAFILITDDSAVCMYEDDAVSVHFGAPEADPFEDALMFHSALLAKAPEQLGVPPDVRYQFYSFVGMQENAASAPYFPHEELVDQACATAASQGLVYQALSVVTDSLRYPVCEGVGFDSVFRVLAQNVVESIKAECTFELPEAPPEQVIDRTSIRLRYTSGANGQALELTQVPEQACDARSFYLRDQRLELCPQACEVVQGDPEAEVEVLYGCMFIVE
jgi:hypothetical protein